MSPRIVFAHYDAPADVGGVSTWLQALVPALRQRGLDVRVHILNFADEPGPNLHYFREAGIPLRTARWPKTFRQGIHQCLEWINADRPDIYVPNSVLPAYYAGAQARLHGMQTVGVLHADDAFFSAVMKEFVAGNPLTRFSAIVPVSEYLNDRARSLTVPPLPGLRIPCGVSVPDRTTTAATDRFRMVYLGRLVEEQKQVSAVARAFCEAAEKNPGFEAVIAGEGPARTSVEKIIAQHPFGKQVRLAGRLNQREVYDLLLSSQAIALLSDYEGLPVSLLEAMACGVVPVCLRMRSGIEELIRSGHNGFMVADREGSFQSAVTKLMADPVLWRECSSNARAAVEKEFSMTACHEKWFSLLTDLQKAAQPVNFPVPMPKQIPQPHPEFAWYEPDAMDRLLPFMTPVRNKIGSWRRRIFKESH
jgi:colanic acid/amylovoran biosynthesis glycosyltransferase